MRATVHHPRITYVLAFCAGGLKPMHGALPGYFASQIDDPRFPNKS